MNLPLEDSSNQAIMSTYIVRGPWVSSDALIRIFPRNLLVQLVNHLVGLLLHFRILVVGDLLQEYVSRMVLRWVLRAHYVRGAGLGLFRLRLRLLDHCLGLSKVPGLLLRTLLKLR